MTNPKILIAALSALVATGCDTNDDNSDPRSAQLPIVTTNADGEEFLAGTYEPATGAIRLVASVRSGIAASIGSNVAVLDYQGDDSDELDLAVGIAFTEVDLSPGATLGIEAQRQGVWSVEIGQLVVREAAWAQTVPDSLAQTSFLLDWCIIENDNCPYYWWRDAGAY